MRRRRCQTSQASASTIETRDATAALAIIHQSWRAGASACAARRAAGVSDERPAPSVRIEPWQEGDLPLLGARSGQQPAHVVAQPESGGSDPRVLTSTETPHYANFVDAIRAGDAKLLTCDILEGHLSSTLPHLANIAYQVKRQITFDGKARFDVQSLPAAEAGPAAAPGAGEAPLKKAVLEGKLDGYLHLPADAVVSGDRLAVARAMTSRNGGSLVVMGREGETALRRRRDHSNWASPAWAVRPPNLVAA